MSKLNRKLSKEERDILERAISIATKDKRKFIERMIELLREKPSHMGFLCYVCSEILMFDYYFDHMVFYDEIRVNVLKALGINRTKARQFNPKLYSKYFKYNDYVSQAWFKYGCPNIRIDFLKWILDKDL